MVQVSFIHCSDVHLGYQQFNKEERFGDFGKAFAQVVDYALENRVDFVLISGDFFHKRAINAETLGQAMDLLSPLKSGCIPVVAIEGNHDKALYLDKSSWLSFLNRQGYLKLLKPEFVDGRVRISGWDEEKKEGTFIDVAGVRIYGLGYLGATTNQRLREAAEQVEAGEDFTIMMLHGAVDKFLLQDLGGISREILENYRGKVDYFALGHIHSRQELDEWIYNPGSLECCHLNEAGQEKGFYHVLVEEKKKEVRYMPSRRRAVRRFSIDISGAPDAGAVNAKVLEKLLEQDLPSLHRPMLLVTIYGNIPFSSLAVDTDTLANQIKDKFDCLVVEVVNNANLPQKPEENYAIQNLSREEIERQVLARLIGEQRPEWRNYGNELVDLTLQVKNAVLNGTGPGEVAALATRMARQIPLVGIDVPEYKTEDNSRNIEDDFQKRGTGGEN